MAQISIIIPCYNVAPYIDRCLTSIVNQTIEMDSLQLICVDDASTDDTWLHLQQWEQRFPDNIILIHCEENHRQGAARNLGMQYANTPYIAFLDADDWIEPDYFSTMYVYAEKLGCEIVCCAYERDDSPELTYLNNRKTSAQSRYLVIDSPEKRETFLHLRSMGYSSPCKLIRTDFLIEHGIYFLENLAYEDNFWCSILHLYAEHVFIIEEKLYHYFVNDTSTIMRQNTNYHVDYITVYLNLWEEWKKRGFYPAYRHALEYDYLYSFYLCFLRIAMIRYDPPSFSLFMLLKQLFLERVPNWSANPYLDEHLDDFHKLMLQSLLTSINKKDFLLFTEQAKLYWQINSRRNSYDNK